MRAPASLAHPAVAQGMRMPRAHKARMQHLAELAAGTPRFLSAQHFSSLIAPAEPVAVNAYTTALMTTMMGDMITANMVEQMVPTANPLLAGTKLVIAAL